MPPDRSAVSAPAREWQLTGEGHAANQPHHATTEMRGMMSQPQTPVLPQASPASHDRHRHSRDRDGRTRPPLVERIAGSSARHRKTAVFGWLALVAVVFVGGRALGTKHQPAYNAGQSGPAEQTLHRPGA